MMHKIKLLAVGGIVIGVIAYLTTVFLVDKEDQQTTKAKLMAVQFKTQQPLAHQTYQLLVSNGCENCHSQQAQLPFYAKMPVAKQLIKQDMDMGLAHFDIMPLLKNLANNQPISEVDLAKLEVVIGNNTMPPARYTALHWRSSLSAENRQTLLDWIKQARARHYPQPVSAPQFHNEAIQPISTVFNVNLEKVALGSVLYHDVRLSGDDTVTCASCHGLDKGGVDGLKTSTGIGGAKGPINAPTVFNSAFNIHQFWDGRAEDLQAQAGGPVLNPKEMGSTSFKQVITKLETDPVIVSQFAKVYPDGITENNITNAIAEFEKTLTTPNSRFDQYLKGNDNALNSEEKQGYALFKKYECQTCHVGQAMGGQSFEILGLQGNYFKDRGNTTEVDHGRYNFTKNPHDMHKFKVPTLRNIALTAPYFHDASEATLEGAVAQMAKYQVGVNLSQDEIAKITAFLNTLTGQYQGKQLTL